MPLQRKVSDNILDIIKVVLDEQGIDNNSVVRHLERAMIAAKELEKREGIK